ncbi:hypothetical protein [Ochrobactrum teleogrylli]|uniref:Uncharacterized protein n=1 Tax=Ochrobactrum teleogrylli TaxID=2479765 RepID=A0ABY2Y7N6_9HYPH|nr:hypothetical protein [[Ochrobactrum] teleogrylli]TNV17752.1 hypothetical protein FIC94_06135 [[Ochrobactrum] teleogrylli]
MSIAQGCSTTSSSAEKPVLRTDQVKPDIPKEARKPCDPPVSLPDRALSAKELTPMWAKDRSALSGCEARRAAAVAAVDAVPLSIPVPAERPK